MTSWSYDLSRMRIFWAAILTLFRSHLWPFGRRTLSSTTSVAPLFICQILRNTWLLRAGHEPGGVLLLPPTLSGVSDNIRPVQPVVGSYIFVLAAAGPTGKSVVHIACSERAESTQILRTCLVCHIGACHCKSFSGGLVKSAAQIRNRVNPRFANPPTARDRAHAVGCVAQNAAARLCTPECGFPHREFARCHPVA